MQCQRSMTLRVLSTFADIAADDYQLPLAPPPDEKPPPDDEEEDEDENDDDPPDDEPLDEDHDDEESLGRVRAGVWTMRLSWKPQFRQSRATSSRPP